MDRVVNLMPAVDLDPGTELPGLDVGPFTLTDFVRWAAYQENWLRIHYDRAYATQHARGTDCIQSGHHRTALLTRMITDWLGTRGRLVRLAVRHTGPVFPGDSIRCRGRIRSSTPGGGETVVDLDISAVTTDARLVSEGTASVRIASRAPGERRQEQP
jgi:acyl dehydratase